MIINQAGALQGVRVIDFGRFIAGPYCGMLLADMGADVIRIDRRGGSEDRYVGPVTEEGEGGMFLSLNRNKRSLTLNPGQPQGAAIIRRLVAGADIVIANLPLEVMTKIGITYDSLCAIKSDIILVMISAFGPDGPYAHRVGFDSVAQAISGAMSLTGFPGPPVRALVPFEDFGTALHAAFGAMVALYHRRQTGQGQLVDASLLASGVTFMQSFLAERHVTGRERRQRGNAGFYSAPSDCYPVTDGWIVVAVIGASMFRRWALLVGREDLLEDARFRDDLRRGDQHEAISQIMTAWTSVRTSAQALSALEAARIPAGAAQNLDQVLSDPQVRARALLQYLPYPGADKDVPLANTPVRLSSTPGGIRHRAPMAGEHTDEVLTEIGYSIEEIAEFHRLEVV